MARKAEIGIDYFPMNTDIIHNPKVKLVVAEFGSKTTWAVLLPLLCKIYREKGYWIDWCDEDSKLLFSQDECKVEVNVMNEFVAGCVRRSLFDKGVFNAFGVLTSDRIQENYLEAKKRNLSVSFIEEFAVKNEEGNNVYELYHNVNIIDLNVNIIKKKVDAGTQKKKENKNKNEEGEGDVHTPEQKEMFSRFQKFILKDAKEVDRMKQPFTITEFLKLKESYSSEAIKKMVLQMHNYKKLCTNNVSAYLTFLSWIQRDYNKPDTKASTELSLSDQKAKDILQNVS